MKKNVWILNHYAGGMFFDKGGRHYCFAKYLKRAGYEPVVFGCNIKHNPGTERFFETDKLWEEHLAEEINVPFVFVKARKYSGNGKQRVLNMIDFYQNIKKTALEYTKTHTKPDVIFASSVHPLTLVAGIQLAKYYKIKCICEVRDLWPESIVAYMKKWKKTTPLIKILYGGEKWIYKKANHIIMTWPGGYDYIIDKGWNSIIKPEKVTYVSQGVDIESFESNAHNYPCKIEQLVHSTAPNFVYTGSIRKVNNVELLLDAAEILKSKGIRANILIFGDGDEKEMLESKASEKCLQNIKFMGLVPKYEIPSILKHSDFMILHNSSTPLDKYGQSQNKFFEYLASGKPILMTYSVGHSIIRRKNCGIELDVQSPQAIADAIEIMCKMNVSDYNRICENSINEAKNHDYEYLANLLMGIIDKN